MNYTTRYTTTNLRGFTLVEALASVFLITIVIVGPLTLASNAATYARLTKDTMIATYLGQESVELLRHQQDSVYIRCADQDTAQCSALSGERPDEAAWRLFKARLGNNSQGASCLVSENANGCSYDFIDMTTNEDVSPTKYSSTSSSCNQLSYDKVSRIYVCTGVRGVGLQATTFSRTVKIASIPTLGGSDALYNDDLRATVTVSFRKSSGYNHQVKVIDFLHAKS